MIYLIKDFSKVENLFDDYYLTQLKDVISEEVKIYVDDIDNPTSAMADLSGDLWFVGKPCKEMVMNKPKGWVEMYGQTEEWEKLILECWPEADKYIRNGIDRNPTFDKDNLKRIVSTLPKGYKLKKINSRIYNLCLKDDDLEDLVEGFNSKKDFFKYGCGYVITKKGKVVAGASSCTRYKNGIEIEIDTKKEERRKGLASVCGAALILYCLEHNLTPLWDAANKISVHLAEKLGYKFSHEYNAYVISSIHDIEIKNPDKTSWEKYCGKYEMLIDDFHLEEVFIKDGDLYAKVIDREDGKDLICRLIPIGPNKFGRLWGMVQITFCDDCLIIDNKKCKKIS